MKYGGEGFSGKPNVVIFVAPKENVIVELDNFLNFIRRRGWNVLQVVTLDSAPEDRALKSCDFVITLGGDGTILYASREIEKYEKPILGINFGKIGLLTELSIAEFYNSVDKIEKGDFYIIAIHRAKAHIEHGAHAFPSILNEYVIMTKKPGKILGLEMSVDNEKVGEILCDGLIISTPIGSSSYALSVGGPIVSESVESFVVTPIAPLFRSSFPMIFPSDSIIRVKVMETWMDAILIADGVEVGEIARGEEVEIKYTNAVTKFIRLWGRHSRIRKVAGMVSLRYGR